MTKIVLLTVLVFSLLAPVRAVEFTTDTAAGKKLTSAAWIYGKSSFTFSSVIPQASH